jgi:hypothetical protein
VDNDGKPYNDVTTHKGLNASLPKEDQNKASKSEKTEQDLNKQTLGDSKIFFAIIRDLLTDGYVTSKENPRVYNFFR